MTNLNSALIHHKSLPDPFWSHEFLSGLPSLTSRHVRFVKSGSVPFRLIYPSLSTWMKNQSCYHEHSLDRALKYTGLRGNVGLKKIPPAQLAAVYGSADTHQSSATVYVNWVFPSLSTHKSACCVFVLVEPIFLPSVQPYENYWQETMANMLRSLFVIPQLHSFAKHKQGTFFNEYLSWMLITNLSAHVIATTVTFEPSHTVQFLNSGNNSPTQRRSNFVTVTIKAPYRPARSQVSSITTRVYQMKTKKQINLPEVIFVPSSTAIRTSLEAE